jgi:hypothetical protein
MLRGALVGTVLALFGSAAVAGAAVKDDVQAAVKKLSDSGYSWKQTSEGAPGGGGAGGGAGRAPGGGAGGAGAAGGAGGRRGGGAGGGGAAFGGGPVEGKFADGLTYVKQTMGQNETEFLLKGDKGAIKAGDAGWVALDDQAAARTARVAKAFKLPTVQATAAIDSVKDFTKAEDAYVADLSEDAAKAMIPAGGAGGGGRGGRRGGGGAGGAAGGAPAGGAGAGGTAAAPTPPAISNAKGTITVTMKDGALTKIVYKVSGTMSMGGQDREISRTTTVDFSDVGSTKIEVPAEAKDKMS